MQVALSEDPAWFTPKAGSPAASRGRAADAAGTKTADPEPALVPNACETAPSG